MAKAQSVLERYYLIPFVATALVAALSLLPQYQALDRGSYDVLLGIRPPVEERSEFLLLNADDLAVAQVGMWPWSRHIMADGLILMREFDLNYAVFDIEYVDRSPQGVDSLFLNQEIPHSFAREFESLEGNISALFGALYQGTIPLEEAEEYILQLVDLSRAARERLLEEVHSIARDNDDYLGRAARFFGRAFFTTTMLPDDVGLVTVSDDHRRFILDEIALENVTGDLELLPEARDIQPAIPPVLRRAAGAGFPNVLVDPDGVRRRVDLLSRYQDRIFGQLAFRPLLHWLGSPEIEVKPGSITLRDARHPDGDIRDITIPLSHDGKMLVTWPQKRYDQSFRHLSFNDLYVHGLLEQDLIANLDAMDGAGFLQFGEPGPDLLPAYRYAEDLREEGLATGDSEVIEEYYQVRAFFFDALETFLAGDADEALQAELHRIISHPETPETLRETYREVQEDVEAFFTASRDIWRRLHEVRERLGRELPGSFAVLGHTSISTTDIGVNPFDGQYINVGLHPSVANTILTGDFLREFPPWYGLVAAILLSMVAARLIRDVKPLPAAGIGLGLLAATIALAAGLFIGLGWYLPILDPLLAVFLTSVAISLAKFLKAEGDKSFYLSAFSRYLSADVIGQIIEDPERLKLGGDSKELTAIFTDVKGFSTIAEQMTPADLVRLLNEYLTAMSDIILELYGTIDKYEGDAIIAFFGAPLDLEDHSWRACAAAVRMKAIERELNPRFLESGLAPGELLTRVGINTGEMVVGNMGTPKKMDYTIMGHAVNLAARLEGVNKQYGTWTLTTEQTIRAAGLDSFLTRRLDRVRVVGVKEPVRLYEIIAESTSAREEDRELAEIFLQGLTLFEERNYTGAQKYFQEAKKRSPQDGPATVYLERCVKYGNAPPAETWDGVYNLTSK
ncbi:adenylate/guanylate cyclase with Chase sensor [Alkalispirochaeta sphaeroplastigenens]|uniref:Adenylate/guanylate cyclase with Chase sensor n=1 Tax=Alkalispirochaeta sphaeroplastigenens TaxID=1187066 RepID=A0A2S4JWT9_9SPIO|nr:adenylate/guanylate cyclase domain-containing protein [Alkalispirochaeta sphaeroplastigenens]POR03997.1 adenylate/guanylate cyclase with Chase sensor [Alkalispirochaeta sphaeroplastigenens]